MEEILSSIKRIIREEGEAAAAAPRPRRPARPAPEARPEDAEREEVLELSEAVPEPSAPAPAESAAAEPPKRAEPILSAKAAEETRGRLEALSRMVVKPETAGSDTLEGLVREMLKPMLSEWLDANLPRIVEAMVAREISRITGRA